MLVVLNDNIKHVGNIPNNMYENMLIEVKRQKGQRRFMSEVLQKAIEIFISYTRQDEKLLSQLLQHLKPLQKSGSIHLWHDKEIPSGTEWEQEVDTHIHSAQIILLLVSPEFVASNYRREVEAAMKRHNHGQARVIPIILRPTVWESTPFSKLRPLPSNGKPVTHWLNRDDAFLDITRGIQLVCKELQTINEPLTQKHAVPGRQNQTIKQPAQQGISRITNNSIAVEENVPQANNSTSYGDHLSDGSMKAGRDIRTNNPWPALLFGIALIIAILIFTFLVLH